MNKQSAGILLYRYRKGDFEVFLVHPGGPFYTKKDEGSWSIPKGEYELEEDPMKVAKREFKEETGNSVPEGEFIPLTPVKLKSGKLINAWAVESTFEIAFIRSNDFQMEWPPKSGIKRQFPEVDKAEWFNITAAAVKIHPAQLPLLKDLEMILHLRM